MQMLVWKAQDYVLSWVSKCYHAQRRFASSQSLVNNGIPWTETSEDHLVLENSVGI